MLSPQCGGVVFTPVASSFGLVFSVWFGPAGERLGLQIIRPHYSGTKRPDSDVRIRRAVIITARLTDSPEPIFLYPHSQNWFEVFTTSPLLLASLHSSHLGESLWRCFCVEHVKLSISHTFNGSKIIVIDVIAQSQMCVLLFVSVKNKSWILKWIFMKFFPIVWPFIVAFQSSKDPTFFLIYPIRIVLYIAFEISLLLIIMNNY